MIVGSEFRPALRRQELERRIRSLEFRGGVACIDLPPAIGSFMTVAPSWKIISVTGTQNVLGVVAESKCMIRSRWSYAVRHSVEDTFGWSGGFVAERHSDCAHNAEDACDRLERECSAEATP